MALVRRLISRLRNRRGFGVHSPFAFDFITHTLRSYRGYRYYGTEQLSSRQRLLYRVVVRLQPERIELCGDCSELTPVLEALGDQALRPVQGRRDMGAGQPLVICGPGCGQLPEGSDTDSNVMLLRPNNADSRRLWKTLLHATRHGMSFSRRGLCVYVNDPRLPRQDFRV